MVYKNCVLYEFYKKDVEVQDIQKTKNLLNIDVRKVLAQVEAKYGLKLPKKVVTIDFGEDMGDLYVRFRHAERTEDEATADGKAIVHYDKQGRVADVEITDITTL